jgi:alkanesulfonate monooxygenase SsuD/methylene tetrahydromethanopterin reductase-like flavin-dependent oxidoreductase (luciferase family)
MKALKEGVLLSTRLASLEERDDDSARFVAQGALAEALGFDSVWVGDSLVARPRLEPIALLGALAARTSRIMLGTAVFLPAIRHPVSAAHLLAIIDSLSRGRLTLGIGTGFKYSGTERELRVFDIPMEQRVGRVLESVTIWRKLWRAEGGASHSGRYWSFDSVEVWPRPSRPGGPPIWMGGNSPAAISRAAENADGFIPTSASSEVFRQAAEQLDQRVKRIGRPKLPTAVVLTINVNQDRDRARRELREYMEVYYGAPLEALSKFIGCFAGTTADCAEWITGFVSAGADHLIFRFASTNQLEQFERAAADLLSTLKLKRRDNRSAESVGRAYAEAWRRGDLQAQLGLCADEIVLHYFGESPFAGLYEGKAELVRLLSKIQERTRRELVAVDDVLSSDERTALLVRERFHGGERPQELERLFLYRVDRGCIVECWLYDQDQRAFDTLLS